MLRASFEGCILKRYGSYDVVRNDYKYIQCNFTNPFGFMTITLMVRSTFVMTFLPWVNVGVFVQMSNFGVMFKNKFKQAD
jgi:hypothetical protein